MLAPCPACGSFSLHTTESVPTSGQAVPARIHVECSRCHWIGAGDTVLENDQLTALTNVNHNEHLWW